MNQGQMLDRLVENALDFLRQSLADFDLAPKYSVIHFYAAVELFLKARLLAEHWSLVVAKRQDPDLKRFESADFQSVSLDEAAEKLDRVVQSPLAPAELTQFRNLAKHRNRMVHFFHEIATAEAENELKQQIAVEQLKAWYFLNRLLLERWETVFGKWKNELAKVTKGLKRHHDYLQVVFDHMKPEIDAKMAVGCTIEECPSCGFKAAEVDEILGELKQSDCMVCQFDALCLTVACPNCGHAVIFINDGFSRCTGCDHKMEPDDLAELLTEDRIGTKDYFESGLPAHCPDCNGYRTVIEHGGKFLCTCCFQIYESEHIHPCGWCGDLNAGDMDDSFLNGCVACEGRVGHDQDKDD
jgi:hypothetical protein